MKSIIKIVFLISLFSLFVIPTKDSAEELKINEMSTKEQVWYFSDLYNVDYKLIDKIIECESKYNNDVCSDGGRSCGVAQFQKPTFNELSKKMGEDLDYYSEYDQVKLLAWSVSNGYGKRWTAYRAIQNDGVYSFYSKQLKQHFTAYCKL